MTEAIAPDWRHQLQDAVLALHWDPAGKRLAAGCVAGELVTFELSGGAKSTVAVLEHDVLSVQWSCDGEVLAAGGSDGTLGLWANGAVRAMLSLGRWAGAIAWAPDRRVLAVAAGADAYVVDSEGAVLAEYLLHPGYVNDVAWEPSGDLLVASVGGIRFYDTDVSGRGPAAFAASTGTILKLAPSPDGAMLAAGKSNGCVVVWRLDGGTGTVLSGSDGGVAHLSWSPDGSRLAVAVNHHLIPEGVRQSIPCPNLMKVCYMSGFSDTPFPRVDHLRSSATV